MQLAEPLTLGEEIANAVTHGIGAALSVAGLVILIWLAAVHGSAWHVVACAIYGSSLLFAYMSSTLYHALTPLKAKQVFRILDHSSIYFLIAGTYTPFVFAMRDWLSLTVLAIVWTAAICGIVFKSAIRTHDGLISTILYIALGWTAVLMVRPLVHAMPRAALYWIVAGGVAYTAGTVFFASSRRYMHTVWHLFVLAGSICHFVAVLRYVALAPPRV